MTFQTITLLNNESHPNHTLTSTSNPEPPNQKKKLGNQPHTADNALVILATTKTLSETQKMDYLKASPSFRNKKKDYTKPTQRQFHAQNELV